MLARQAYTGCTDAANPAGESGRPLCYVKAQVPRLVSLSCCRFVDNSGSLLEIVWSVQLLEAGGASAAWGYCGALGACAFGAMARGVVSTMFCSARPWFFKHL